MFKKIHGLFSKRKTLREHLTETVKIRVRGINFEIRKLSPLDHLEGSQTLVNHFDTFNNKIRGDAAPTEADFAKNAKVIKKHYGDVILAAVVSPKLTRDVNPGEMHSIDSVLHDWDLAQELYNEIMGFTYGKKKILQSIYLANS